MEVAALTPLGNPAVTCCMYCTKRLRYVTTLLCIFKTKHLEITQQNIKMNSMYKSSKIQYVTQVSKNSTHVVLKLISRGGRE